jgi:hypothetical protein
VVEGLEGQLEQEAGRAAAAARERAALQDTLEQLREELAGVAERAERDGELLARERARADGLAQERDRCRGVEGRGRCLCVGGQQGEREREVRVGEGREREIITT